MKTLFRTLSTLLVTVLLFACGEQEELTGPDSENPSKPAGSPSGLSISSISPTSAEIGDVITITGTNFGGTKLSTSSVTIKGIPATVFLSWSSTSISVLVPSGTVPGAGSVIVTLKTKTSNAVNFTLLPSSPVTIGNQVWMGANLDVATYRNGDPIPQVTDATAWANMTTGAWCYPNNDPVTGPLYGKLYNWYAVNDPRGLAPLGWHVPSETEWKTLFIYLGMSPQDADGWGYPPNAYYGTNEGGMLKEAGTSLWYSPNTGATNSTGFTALPGGYRSVDGSFLSSTGHASGGWWAATEYNAERAWMRMVVRHQADTYRNNLVKHMGWSVRCIQDN